MGQDPRKVETMYDSVAKEYAENFRDEHQHKPMDRAILRRFSEEIRNRAPVWDLGCGPGQTTAFLKNLGLQISGLDISARILEQARTLHPEIRFKKGSLLDLEFDDESIAGAVAFYAIVHFSKDQVQTAFQEIFRVLKPGGIFLLSFHIGQEKMHLDEFLGMAVDIDFMFFTTDFIRRILEGCGFERIEVIEREPYPEVEYQSRRAYVFAYKPAD
jgi:ubiquinone/menaquinone biosynthesis C-methylase UbiE